MKNTFSCKYNKANKSCKILFKVHVDKYPLDSTPSGLNAEDLKASVDSLKLLCEACDADIVLLREKSAEEGTVAEYLVRNRADESDFMEVR